MKTLTVFTPAYNRAHTIGRTYESLCRQTCKDFEWLVVDDGSTDHTRELVEGWIADDVIPIRYVYQENQGMHGAHNTAYANIRTELNVCIDSDDWMPDDAVEKIISFWQKKGNEKYAGFIGLDQYSSGGVLGELLPVERKETTFREMHEILKMRKDKKYVYRTDVIKKYLPYPIFEGEKYYSLASVYAKIDKDYKLLMTNDILAIIDYQDEGSSRGMWKQYWNNPRGMAHMRKTDMVEALTFKRKVVSNIHYVSHSIRSKNWKFIQESPMPWLTFLCLLPGVILYLVNRQKVKKGVLMKTS